MSSPNGLGVVVPAGVVDAVRELTGVASLGPTLATVGGFSNLSFHVTLNNRLSVVKAATLPLKREDLRREAKILSLLHVYDDMTLPAPRMVAHGDHGDWTVTVLDEVPGENGLTFLGKRSLGYVEKRSIVLARLLQAVHRAAPQPVKDPDLDIPTRMVKLRSFVVDEVFADGVSAQMLSALDSRAIGRGVGLVHGDFGLHNVMWDVDVRRIRVGGLLDWEFGGWGSPLTDVAWLWWTLQFRGIGDQIWPYFVDAYGAWALRAMGFESGAILDLVRVQMIQLLSRTERESASRIEWLKRWTALESMSPPSLPL
jgi:aminoglycoside phosphotransferase (APT) family kinase protein